MSSFTHPYARAFLEAAPPGYDVAGFLEAGQNMANAFKANPALRAFLLAPNVPRDAKSKAIAAIAARVGPRRVRRALPPGHAAQPPAARGRGRLQDPARPERPEAEHPARAADGPGAADRRRAQGGRRRHRRAHRQERADRRSRSIPNCSGDSSPRRDPGCTTARWPPPSGGSRRKSTREREPENGNQGRRDHRDPEAAAGRLREGDRRGRGRHGALGRRRHRARVRPRQGHGGRARGLRPRHLRPRAQPRAGPGRRRAARRVADGQGRPAGQAHAAHHPGAGRSGARRPRRGRPRPPDRRQGPDQGDRVLPDRAHRAGRHRPPGRQGARADGPEGDRRHDPDRPRPARADHRRPPDRQDRHRPGHDHQPEGQGRHLHLRRHRTEEVDGRAGRQDARGKRRARPHDHRFGDGVGPGPAALHRALLGLRDGRVVPLQQAARADDLRRSLQARRGVPRDLAAAAPAARPRGVPGRRLLPALAPARARRPSSRTRRAAGR